MRGPRSRRTRGSSPRPRAFPWTRPGAGCASGIASPATCPTWSALKKGEPDTFAGLWGKRPPGHGYVVLFTRDGEETLRHYLEGAPERFRRLFEARSGAEATAAELEAAQRGVGRVFDRLKNEVASSATNVKKNRVEVYAKDKERFEAALQEAGARLPEHVIVLESGLCCPKLE